MCSHLDCNISFKTNRQKLMHHDKLDKECRSDKNNIIRLIAEYKHIFEKMKTVSSFQEDEGYLELKRILLKCRGEIIERDYFDMQIGKEIFDLFH